MSQGLQKIGASVASPDRLLARQTRSPEEIAFATKAAAVLFGSYPAAKAHDPEIFTATVTALFLRYPRHVVQEVVRELPLTRDRGWDGIPSPARIREALEIVTDRYEQARMREKRIAGQIAEREEIERARASAPTREEFSVRHPDIAKRLGWVDVAPTKETEEEICARLGITREQWDVIPGATGRAMWFSK